MQSTLHLFKTSCVFIHKHLKLKTFRTTFNDRECQGLFNLSRLRSKYSQIDRIQITDYTIFSQYELIKKTIELSLGAYFNQLLKINDEEDCFGSNGAGAAGGSDSSASAASILNKNKQHH